MVPTAETFALRLDGTVDFRIDFNDNNDSFGADENVFLLDGSFVLSFAGSSGINVAVFSEPAPGTIAPATLKIGPSGSPYMQFGAFGFMAIRSSGFAANLILSLDVGLPGSLAAVASVSGQMVFMVNTTREDISFDIPASGADPNPGRAAGLTVAIPRAPPASIADFSGFSVFDLITGNAWAVPGGAAGVAYALIHLGGTDDATDPDAVLTVGPYRAEGAIHLPGQRRC